MQATVPFKSWVSFCSEISTHNSTHFLATCALLQQLWIQNVSFFHLGILIKHYCWVLGSWFDIWLISSWVSTLWLLLLWAELLCTWLAARSQNWAGQKAPLNRLNQRMSQECHLSHSRAQPSWASGTPTGAAAGAWLILLTVTSRAGIFSGCHRLHCNKYLVASLQLLLFSHTCRIHLSSIFMMTSIL